MVIGTGKTEGVVGTGQVREILAEGLAKLEPAGKNVLVILPDHTRSGPIAMFFKTFCELLSPKVKCLTFLIALGTHPPLGPEKMDPLLGMTAAERARRYKNVEVYNHRWDDPEQLVTVGTIGAEIIAELSGGLMREEVVVRLNKMVVEHELVIICGPVFPHEVVGFSGGNKYFFPGVAAEEIINFTHWLGAVVTSPRTIGYKQTATRKVIDMAAGLLKVPRAACKFVVQGHELKGVYFGDVEEAWSEAADLSAKINTHYVDRAFHTVLAAAPTMYEDIWTAGKCMYKLESVVADGGKLIIYAPHIEEVSYTHGELIERAGYHVRDYFLKQADKFADIPGGTKAHCTHVKGIGTFEDQVEKPRVEVVLATKISPERCKRINLGYMNPDEIDLAEYQGREDEGILYVAKAGEILYRLKNPPDWQKA